MTTRDEVAAPPEPFVADGDEEARFWRSGWWWRRAGHTSAAQLIATALAFASTVAAARILLADGFGAVELAVVSVSAIVTLLDLSLEEAVVFYGAPARAGGDHARVVHVLRVSLLVDIAIGLAVFGILFAVAGPFADVVSGGELSPALVQLAALEALLTTANGTTGAALVVYERPHVRVWSTAFANAGRLMGVVVAGAVSPTPVGVLCGFVAGSAAGAALQAVLAWSTVRVRTRDHNASASGSARSVGARALVTFGSHTSVSTTLIALRLGLISVVIGRALGPVAVGVFSVATFPVAVIEVASSPLRLLAMPEQAVLVAKGRRDLVWEGLVAFGRATLVVGAVGAVAAWFLLPWLLPALYGDAYTASVEPARVLVVAAVAGLSVAWGKGLPAAIGRPAVRTVMTLIELVLTALALLVVPRDDVMWIAVAVSAVAVVMVGVWWTTAHRILTRAPAITR